MSEELLEATDAWLTRPKISLPRLPHLYPSEASVEITDKDGTTHIEGTCLRAAYLRYTGEVVPKPTSARTELIFAMGTLIEGYLIDKWKEMGIWVSDHAKFSWPEYNVSGEIDVILIDPDTKKLYGVEAKTFYGYDAHKNIIGSKWHPGFPKMNQLLQTCVYTYFLREKLDHFKMIYFARDDVKRREFKIEVIQEEDIWYPVIDGKIFREFSINKILDRYTMLNDYIDSGVIPPPDYQLVWDKTRVEKEKIKGNVSKTAYEEWTKGKRLIGDWQCSYCNYKDFCWGSESDKTTIEEGPEVC